MQTGSDAMADGSSVENVDWYYVTEIPVHAIIHSADGTEQYVVERDEVIVFTPVVSNGDRSDSTAAVHTAESGHASF
jgi:hypothetical protein